MSTIDHSMLISVIREGREGERGERGERIEGERERSGERGEPGESGAVSGEKERENGAGERLVWFRFVVYYSDLIHSTNTFMASTTVTRTPSQAYQSLL